MSVVTANQLSNSTREHSTTGVLLLWGTPPKSDATPNSVFVSIHVRYEMCKLSVVAVLAAWSDWART